MPVPSKRALVEFLADGLSLPAGWIRTSRSAGSVESVEWGSGELVRWLCVNSGKHDRLLRNWWVEFSVPEVDRQYAQLGGFQVMLPVPEVEALTREGYPRPRSLRSVDPRLVGDVGEWAPRLLTFVADVEDLGRLLLHEGALMRARVTTVWEPEHDYDRLVDAVVIARLFGLADLEREALAKVERRGEEPVPNGYRERDSYRVAVAGAAVRRQGLVSVPLDDLAAPWARRPRRVPPAARTDVPQGRQERLGAVEVWIPHGWSVEVGEPGPGEDAVFEFTSALTEGSLRMTQVRWPAGQTPPLTAVDAVRDVIRAAGGGDDIPVEAGPGINGADVVETVFRRHWSGDGSGAHVTDYRETCHPQAERWIVTGLMWAGLLVCCTAAAPHGSKFVVDAVASLIPSVTQCTMDE